MIDDFGKKNQVDTPRRMQPIINEYFTSYLEAQRKGDDEASRTSIIRFGERVNLLLSEGYEDYMTIQAETHSLKLIATEQLAAIFGQLEMQYSEAFKLSQQFMNEFAEMTVRGDNEKIQAYQKEMYEKGTATKATVEALMSQMRAELQEI